MLPRCHGSLCQAPPSVTAFCPGFPPDPDYSSDQLVPWQVLEAPGEVGSGMRWVSVAGDGQNQIVPPIEPWGACWGVSLRLPAASIRDGCIPSGLAFLWPGLELSAMPKDHVLLLCLCSLCSHLPRTPLDNQSLCSGSG